MTFTAMRRLCPQLFRVKKQTFCSLNDATRRYLSVGAPVVDIQKKVENKTAVVRMNRPPANSLNVDLMKQLTEAIVSLEKDPEIDGIILASSSPKIFCAGLDLMELAKKDLDIKSFWGSLQELWLTLYGTKLATVAAVQGMAPAAGCLLALSCDYRVMSPKLNIGMNETKFGLIAPTWFQASMVNTVGHRASERLLGIGLLVDTAEAHRLGMVDEVCPQEEVIPAAERELKTLLSVDQQARWQTKMSMRFETLERLRESREMDLAWFTQSVTSPAVQASLTAYIASLKARPARPPA